MNFAIVTKSALVGSRRFFNFKIYRKYLEGALNEMRIRTSAQRSVLYLDALPFPLEDDLLLDRDLPRLFDLDLKEC